MSICPTNTNSKYKAYLTHTNDSNKKAKDERPQTGNVSRRFTRKQSVDGRRGGIDIQKYSPIEKRNTGKQPQQQQGPQKKYDKKSKWMSHETNNYRPDGCGKIASKKASLNHLLNFKFEPRNRGEQWTKSLPVSSTRQKSKYGHEVFSHEKFIQANCHFLVSECGEYDIHYIDPDLPLPWDKVEQVCMWNEVPPSCPICLSPPIVPKVTKCGHIYCWPCILHYLALGDENSNKCPICHEMVHAEDLRSVTVTEEEISKIGDEIVMKLMYCSRSDGIPHPVYKDDGKCGPGLPLDLQRHMKIKKVSPLHVLNTIVEKEMERLKNKKLMDDLDLIEIMFLDAAMKECKKREEELIAMISDRCCYGTIPLQETSISDVSNDEENGELRDPPLGSGCSPKAEVVTSYNPKDLYYFYQCIDGRRIYVHGLNIKCLLKEFSNFSLCPNVIQGRVVELESFTMNQALRKRHRYLSHLPLSCEFKVVELEVQIPNLSQETLDEFKGQFERRAKVRGRKEKEESKLSRRAELNTRRNYDTFEYGNQGCSVTKTPLYNFAASGSISVFLPQNIVSIGGNEQSEFEHSIINGERSNSDNRSLISFAQMLKCGEVKTSRPQAKCKMQEETAPISLISSNYKKDTRNNSDDPDYEPPPTYQSAFEDALSDTLHRVTKLDENPLLKVDPVNKKGKRKKKQTLLFSTSTQMQHF